VAAEIASSAAIRVLKGIYFLLTNKSFIYLFRLEGSEGWILVAGLATEK
jgi:hypothetical protein